MAPQNPPQNSPDPSKTNPPAGNENGGEGGQQNPPAPPNPPSPPAPPAPPAKEPALDAPVAGDCEGVTKGLRKLVTEQYGKDYVILSVGRGKAFIQNARHAFKIDATTGSPTDGRPRA